MSTENNTELNISQRLDHLEYLIKEILESLPDRNRRELMERDFADIARHSSTIFLGIREILDRLNDQIPRESPEVWR